MKYLNPSILSTKAVFFILVVFHHYRYHMKYVRILDLDILDFSALYPKETRS